jgi:UDP-N-acetylmuramoylalanine--D-glutamate ligase
MPLKRVEDRVMIDTFLSRQVGSDKLVIFVGFGHRARRAANLLKSHGIRVQILEQRSKNQVRSSWRGSDFPSSEEIVSLDVIFEVDGEKVVNYITNASAAVLSPGVSLESAVSGAFAHTDIPTYSNVELEIALAGRESILIVGTNGKTSTASILKQMMLGEDRGLTSSVAEEKGKTPEIFTPSALEIEASANLSTRITACVNSSPAFLERYGSSARYLATLKKAFERQVESDFCVLNYDDSNAAVLRAGLRSRIIGVSRQERMDVNPKVQGWIRIVDTNLHVEACNVQRIFSLLGTSWTDYHNMYNAALSVGLAVALGLSEEQIQYGLTASEPELYRQTWSMLQPSGIPVCNDAKSTNIHATRAALASAVDRYPHCRIVLLMGGIAQEADWFSLVEEFRGVISRVVCYGTDASLLAAASRSGGCEVIVSSKFAEAVETARRIVIESSNQLLLFSPGCLSFDEFLNYRQRGLKFDALVDSC